MQISPTSPSLNLFSWRHAFVLTLLSLICVITVVIVQLQHNIRHLETQYSKSIRDRVVLHEEKGRLLLEKYHLTALSKVEVEAKEKLNMKKISAKSNNIQIIFLDNIEYSDNAVQ